MFFNPFFIYFSKIFFCRKPYPKQSILIFPLGAQYKSCFTVATITIYFSSFSFSSASCLNSSGLILYAFLFIFNFLYIKMFFCPFSAFTFDISVLIMPIFFSVFKITFECITLFKTRLCF